MTTKENQNQFFQRLLQDYLNAENEIKMLNEAIKKRRDKKKNLSESILAFIKKNEINKINLDGDFKGHQLCEKITKSENISKDEIMSIFENHFQSEKNEEKFNILQEEIKKKTVVKESSKLSMQKIRMSKKQKTQEDENKINELIENELNDDLPDHLSHLN
jgi:hypothetical protein